MRTPSSSRSEKTLHDRRKKPPEHERQHHTRNNTDPHLLQFYIEREGRQPPTRYKIFFFSFVSFHKAAQHLHHQHLDRTTMNGNNGESSPLLSPIDNDDEPTTSNALTTSLRNVGAALAQEYQNVKNALVDAMEDTEDTSVVFMSMGLTKAASILPSKPEVVQTMEELEDSLSIRGGTPLRWVPNSVRNTPASSLGGRRTPAALVKTKPPTVRAPWQAYLTLGMAVCALSSIGPFLARQKNVSPSLKVRPTNEQTE
eukprot:scaffold2667_cov237-Amphora_coffeaeformis.AAC.3